MCGGGHEWQGVGHGGGMRAGETATEAIGTHPTGMLLFFQSDGRVNKI